MTHSVTPELERGGKRTVTWGQLCIYSGFQASLLLYSEDPPPNKLCSWWHKGFDGIGQSNLSGYCKGVTQWPRNRWPTPGQTHCDSVWIWQVTRVQFPYVFSMFDRKRKPCSSPSICRVNSVLNFLSCLACEQSGVRWRLSAAFSWICKDRKNRSKSTEHFPIVTFSLC